MSRGRRAAHGVTRVVDEQVTTLEVMSGYRPHSPGNMMMVGSDDPIDDASDNEKLITDDDSITTVTVGEVRAVIRQELSTARRVS